MKPRRAGRGELEEGQRRHEGLEEEKTKKRKRFKERRGTPAATANRLRGWRPGHRWTDQKYGLLARESRATSLSFSLTREVSRETRIYAHRPDTSAGID